MRPRGVTLDAFGTLLDHGLGTIEDAAAEIARDFDLPVGAGGFLEAWQERYFGLLNGGPFRTIAEANGISLRETASAFGASGDLGPYLDRMLERWTRLRPYPESPRVLEALRGTPVAVVSNADHALLLQVLRDGGIPLPHVISSERARCYKPDPRIFREALRELGLAPGEVLHVGDSLDADVRGAAAVGMRTVWVNRRGLTRGDGPQPDHELRDLDGLLDLLI